MDSDLESESDLCYEMSNSDFESDSDSNYSSTDEEDVIDLTQMSDWIAIMDPFDKLSTDISEFCFDYNFHPAIVFQDCMETVNCLESFVSSSIVKKLCEWTDQRADKYFNDNPHTAKKVFGLTSKQVTTEEMYVFIALYFLSGLTKYPQISDYWSTDNICTGPSVFTNLL
ncbi:uncharacterized protein [Diabrotica undecimpunctata]|uniref:uncharacterized protein n=1 Tax=Diabrotica undecimpunctata TaxID=50387 RepID=UPI003B63FE61